MMRMLLMLKQQTTQETPSKEEDGHVVQAAVAVARAAVLAGRSGPSDKSDQDQELHG